MAIFLPQLRGFNAAAATPSTVDAATIAWVNAVVAAGGTVSATQQGYVDTLIRGLKADGVWSKLDRLWLYASENAQQAKIDLVVNATHVANGTPTFTANHGYKGDGSTGYLATGYTPSVNGVQWTQNNASFGFYIRIIESLISTNFYFCATNNNTSAANGMRQNTGGTQYNFALNAGTGAFQGYNTSPVTGRFHAERTASNVQTLYKNGVSVQSAGQPSTGIANSEFFVLAANNGSGAAQNFCDAELGYFYVGAAGIVVSMDARLTAYLTSVGGL